MSTIALNCISLDIETIPDTETYKRANPELDDWDDKAVGDLMFERQREKTSRNGGPGSDFLPPAWHKIACISLAVKNSQKGFLIVTLDPDEPENVERGFRLDHKIPAAACYVQR